ncbi:hypothetical protein [Sphingosinicella microcystinivorans]|uniref:Uncharacterized protein n=1 Tax=Sphingosinicella microcystinivorans TaxID=335406 RepID=A0AAD1D9N1_SPHMI|nr:hypothetical protein [Sphingosinicella microcystinivorans]RKS92244.1 hypothetical protein DFR51_1831 [Sphingosinicella microcystinivorans]BBE35266.1 hypothetical protein SmB9_29240 [Sphingosinicella microcystinivorans]
MTPFPDPRDPALWTSVLSPSALAEVLAILGDSATAYWTTRPVDDLRWEMRSSRQNNAPVRYQIARSALAARGIHEDCDDIELPPRGG